MNKQSNTNGSKRSILEEIDRELAEEARIPRYRLLSPKDSKRLKYLTGQLFIGGFFTSLGALYIGMQFESLFVWYCVIGVVIAGAFAVITSGALTTFSKPDWQPTMTMPYKRKVRRDDVFGVLAMLLGMGLIAIVLFAFHNLSGG